MSKHSGSARDPFSVESSKTSSTPGLAWVVIGFVVICVAVAATGFAALGALPYCEISSSDAAMIAIGMPTSTVSPS